MKGTVPEAVESIIEENLEQLAIEVLRFRRSLVYPDVGTVFDRIRKILLSHPGWDDYSVNMLAADFVMEACLKRVSKEQK